MSSRGKPKLGEAQVASVDKEETKTSELGAGLYKAVDTNKVAAPRYEAGSFFSQISLTKRRIGHFCQFVLDRIYINC